MSKKDKGEGTSARVAAPIVLMLSRNGQDYLNDNEVLRVLYGDQAPRRFSFSSAVDYQNIKWYMFNPDLAVPDYCFSLLVRFDDVPAKELAPFIKSERFYRSVFEYILELTGLAEDESQDVRVVVCRDYMLQEDLPVAQVVKLHFPNATILSCKDEHNPPKRPEPKE